jgi:subtilisin family serine protease
MLPGKKLGNRAAILPFALAALACALAAPAARAATHGLVAAGPGSVLREGDRVVAYVRFDRGAAVAVEDLRDAGAKVADVSRRYQMVTVAAKPGQLDALSAAPGVANVSPVSAPIVAAACSGSVTSEGDSQLGAASAREAFNIDGSGVTVGILSDSFDTAGSAPTHAAGDVASGDLPGPGNPCGHTQPVGVFEDLAEPGTADEGRAMAQIVHDLAPGAAIDFATAFGGEFSFADNIRTLASAGASVITDDVFYPEEPFFQDGPVAVAANEVAAHGAAYFSAAGNDNLFDAGGHEIASWEAPEYRDSADCPLSLKELSEKIEVELDPSFGLNPNHCMDFDPGGGIDRTFGVTVKEGETLVVDLQWAEPWFGVNTDIDSYLFDSSGEPLEAGLEANPGPEGTQKPFEIMEWENTGGNTEVQLVINRFSGSEPRLKFALLENGGGVSETEYPQSSGGDTVGPTIFGHSGATGAVGVGAVRFNTTSAPEEFSSRGPLSHYFGPVSGASPAAPISPQTLHKPDLAATDCGVTTFFAQFVAGEGAWRFCGTSAAAPHAAAVAALMRQANPSLPLSQLRAALAATAQPVGGFGPDAVGAGLVNAFGAVGSVALAPTVSITQAPEALSRNRSPIVGFKANRPVTFSCSVDGGPLLPCSSPFVPPTPLADGVHGIAVRGVDVAGRAGVAETGPFRVDRTAPRTFFRKHPRRVIRTRHRKAKAVFSFRSNEQGVDFICRIDGGLFRFCKARLARRFRIGRHVVKVKARDVVGNVDPSPAVFHFRVERRD